MRGYRGYGGVTEPVSAPGNGQRPRGVGVGEAGKAQPRRCPPSPGPEVTSLPPLAPPRRSSGAVPVPLPRGRPIRGGPPPARPRLRCHPLSSPPHPPAHGHVSPPGGEGGRAVPSRGRGLAVPRSGPALLSHGLPAARRRELCPHPAVPIPPPAPRARLSQHPPDVPMLAPSGSPPPPPSPGAFGGPAGAAVPGGPFLAPRHPRDILALAADSRYRCVTGSGGTRLPRPGRGHACPWGSQPAPCPHAGQ